MKKYLVFVGMGFELIGIVLASLWVGMWIESKQPMRNLWPVLLVFLGLSAWFYRVVQLLKKLNDPNEK
jgi:hypothetical protein